MRKSHTKALIAETLKELCKNRKLENITVQDISQACEINRGTFYYHFCDIQELISWIFHMDITIPVRKIITERPMEQWNEISPFYLNTLYGNKSFYLQALKITEQNDLKSFMLKETHENLLMCTEIAMQNYKENSNSAQANYEKIDFIINYHTKGSIALIEDWAKNDMKFPPNELASFLDSMFLLCIEKISSYFEVESK